MLHYNGPPKRVVDCQNGDSIKQLIGLVVSLSLIWLMAESELNLAAKKL